MKPVIAITVGDFNGIGPEVTLKALLHPRVVKEIHPILVGPIEIFEYYARKFKIDVHCEAVDSIPAKFTKNILPVIVTSPVSVKQIQIGKNAPDAGVCAGAAIERAIRLCLDNHADAMVTAPVSKEALHSAGYNFPGQTEMLALLTRSDKVTMMLVTKAMRVALATVHLPINKVSDNISQERLADKLMTVRDALQKDLGISVPRIAVLGLNPHAGENGAIGREELESIIPAIAAAKKKNINAEGPFPADGFFASGEYKQFDAILAMYHDQGLIPLKMSGFDEGVNYSAGLKIVRTSPDHGTAFNIAGKGIAQPGSMIAAIMLASSIAQQRNK
jgi:4-hydroxythreonine-4-phosphate dehydrogenase